MDDNKWADMVISEIQQLREDMREDVNTLHNKIGKKFDKLDEKLDEKLDVQNEDIKKKVPMIWYRYTLYIAVIILLAMGSSTIANQVSNGRISEKVDAHIKHADETMTKLEKKIDEQIKETRRLINGGKHANK